MGRLLGLRVYSPYYMRPIQTRFTPDFNLNLTNVTRRFILTARHHPLNGAFWLLVSTRFQVLHPPGVLSPFPHLGTGLLSVTR